VGEAVNRAVVVSFLMIFVANFVMTAIYFALIPPKFA
jgi:phospholipid/cholesterol/gamma-HCH transport system permease protein